MSSLFEKTLPVGKQWGYVFRYGNLPTGVTISAATVTVPSDGADIGATLVDGEDIKFQATGVTPGRHVVHLELTLSNGDTDCATGQLTVYDC